MAASNQAAWIPGKALPIKVDSAPTPEAGSDEVVIKNGAVAINPVDWIMQASGLFVKEWPFVAGCDTAGEIVAVGSNVKNVKKGQRVLGHCLATLTGKSEDAAFQDYSAVPALLCAPIPDDMAYESACVLPLSISTAALGLFHDDYLGLPLPVHGPKHTGKTILIWGGSSSVGSSAIQLAVAAGVDVVTTASKRNHTYVSQLGAQSVYDHTSDSVVDDVVSALQDKDLIGVYEAIGHPDTGKACVAILSKLGRGGKIIFVRAPPEEIPAGIEAKWIHATSINKDGYKHIGKAVYEDFLPGALASGQLLPRPEATVVGQGLDKLQEGFDRLRGGVSATKLVVKL